MAGSRPSAACDGTAHDDEVRVVRQLADLRRVAGALVDDADVAVVELGAELLDRGLERRLVVGRPLGKGRVTGAVHADQARHAYLLLGSRKAMIRPGQDPVRP